VCACLPNCCSLKKSHLPDLSPSAPFASYFSSACAVNPNQLEAASTALGLDAAATKVLADEAGWTYEDADGGVFHVVPLPPKPPPFNGMFLFVPKVDGALLLPWSVKLSFIQAYSILLSTTIFLIIHPPPSRIHLCSLPRARAIVAHH